jgi:very-short-patch-repair endonuclease
VDATSRRSREASFDGADGVVSWYGCCQIVAVTEHKRGIYNTTARVAHRKKLRKSLTPAEAVLWKCLQRSQLLGKKFRRQFSIGRYIVGFYCPECRLAIELDGQGHFAINADLYEVERTKYLGSCGIRILRFENEVLFNNLEAVLDVIQVAITETSVLDQPPT